MNPFIYVRARDSGDALRQQASHESAYLGGGTNLVDLMRETVARRDCQDFRVRPGG